jgi:hypothetical protein
MGDIVGGGWQMGYLAFGVVAIGILYALIYSRGFRIIVGLLVVGCIVWVTVANDHAEKQKAANDVAAAKQKASEEAYQNELWTKVSPAQIELRDPTLEPDRFSDEDYEFSAAIKNLSKETVGGFDIDVSVLDCYSKGQCELIGKASNTFWADTPPQQVRAIKGKISFDNMPPPRGILSPKFIIKRVYAGDFADEWGIHSKAPAKD